MAQQDWKNFALKAVVGVAAVTALGVVAYFISKEDEADVVKPRVTKRVGTVIETVMLRDANVIELNQLMRIMDVIREIANEKIEQDLEKRGLTRESFQTKRHELFLELQDQQRVKDDQKNQQAADEKSDASSEYAELVTWHASIQSKALEQTLDVVSRALELEKNFVIFSATHHGKNMQSLSAMTDSIAENEKKNEPKISKAEALQYACFLSEERTRLIVLSKENRETDSVSQSADPDQAK